MFRFVMASGRPEPFSAIIAGMDGTRRRGRVVANPGGCVALVFLAVACARDPIPCLSPVGPGGLAVTEVRGGQADAGDALGQWVEVCNPTAARLPLAGVVLSFARLDGSGERQVLVRDRGLAVDPGGCAVLGLFSGAAGTTTAEGAGGADAAPDGTAAPPYADYDFSDQWDLKRGLYDAAVLEVRACGQVVDRVVYRDLPDRGSWALDGRVAPDAAANDDEARWCADEGEPDQAHPGTPGERNRECGASGG